MLRVTKAWPVGSTRSFSLRAKDQILAFCLGVALWAMLMAVLFFAGNFSTSKFIYVDF